MSSKKGTSDFNVFDLKYARFMFFVTLLLAGLVVYSFFTTNTNFLERWSVP